MRIALLLALLAVSAGALAQGGDSAPRRRSWARRTYDDAIQGIHRNPLDTFEFLAPRVERSEDVFMPYKGKTIRYVNIVQYGFDRQLFDTSSRLGSFASRAASRLHVNTKDWVVRNHLFIRSGIPLDPYSIADNERFLRTLPFIQDVRILPAPIGDNSGDSVDLVVVTKDFFTLSGDADFSGINRILARGFDANFLGMGQRLQVSVLHDVGRLPRWGYDAVFSRSSLGGSFVNGTIGYTTINTGRSDGLEEESAALLRLDRPLVSPNARLAGGFELSRNWSVNVSNKPDSLFYDYRYNVADLWAGVNLNTSAGAIETNVIRDRKFLAFRYLQSIFDKHPFQVGDRFDPIYNDRRAALASLTLFRLDYYKTRYIYGFGLTEDLPHGYNATVTAGWYQQNETNRPYLGLDGVRYSNTRNGKFIQTFFRGGAFLSNGRFEDVGVLAGGQVFSRVYEVGRSKWRQQLTGSVGALFNRTGLEPLRIDNNLGLTDFNTDSLYASQRLSLRTEGVLFVPYKPFGFRLAPFFFAGIAVLTPMTQEWQRSEGYSGIGGGLRARNDNLIFGTMEARMTYFPRVAFGVTPFRIDFYTNLRYRYRSTYVHAPDVFRLNAEVL